MPTPGILLLSAAGSTEPQLKPFYEAYPGTAIILAVTFVSALLLAVIGLLYRMLMTWQKHAFDYRDELIKTMQELNLTKIQFGQPMPPIDSDEPIAWDLVVDDFRNLVIEDMKARDNFGFKKYKVRLRVINNRDALWDTYEEMLDAVAYIRCEIYRRDKLRRLSIAAPQQPSTSV